MSLTTDEDRLLQRVELIDLSLLLAEDLPCAWPAHMPFQHKVFNWFRERADSPSRLRSDLGPYFTSWLTMDEHTGTHFDAPAHAVPPLGSRLPGASIAGAITGERVPVSQLFGRANVIDASRLVGTGTAGQSPWIEPEIVERHEREHGPIEAGEIVLLRSGWDKRYKRGSAGQHYTKACMAGAEPGWPAPTVETIELLLERGTRCVGTDGISIGALHDPGPGHYAGLSKEMVYVECLANLERLPPRGAWFLFLPLLVEGGSGAPGRAIGLAPRTQ